MAGEFGEPWKRVDERKPHGIIHQVIRANGCAVLSEYEYEGQSIDDDDMERAIACVNALDGHDVTTVAAKLALAEAVLAARIGSTGYKRLCVCDVLAEYENTIKRDGDGDGKA